MKPWLEEEEEGELGRWMEEDEEDRKFQKDSFTGCPLVLPFKVITSYIGNCALGIAGVMGGKVALLADVLRKYPMAKC